MMRNKDIALYYNKYPSEVESMLDGPHKNFRLPENLTKNNNFYRCTMHYGIYILVIHQQLHFLLNLEKFNFTLEWT